MIHRRVIVLIVAAAFFVPAVRGAEPDAAKLAEIRTRMQEFVDSGDLAGVVTVVGRKDGVIHQEAAGLLNLESKQPMPKDAIFRIASMTKPITATAAPRSRGSS